MKFINLISFSLISILLFLAIIQWVNYLIENGYLVETFESGNVDLPIIKNTNCNNFCGPLGRCALTGEQCVSDNECMNCLPIHSGKRKNVTHDKISSENVIGDNDSGKSTGNVPNHSTLTSDIGNRAAFFALKQPVRPVSGVNVWEKTHSQHMQYFKKRYHEDSKVLYPKRFSLSGEFTDDGPFAANA